MRPASETTRAVEEAAAEAAGATPGVAFLRPGLAGLVRGSVARRLSGASPVPGVRATRLSPPDGPPDGPADEGGGWRLHVQLAVREGHQTLAVTRAVRESVTAAVTRALPHGEGDGRREPPALEVTVTVIDIVSP